MERWWWCLGSFLKKNKHVCDDHSSLYFWIWVFLKYILSFMCIGILDWHPYHNKSFTYFGARLNRAKCLERSILFFEKLKQPENTYFKDSLRSFCGIYSNCLLIAFLCLFTLCCNTKSARRTSLISWCNIKCSFLLESLAELDFL